MAAAGSVAAGTGNVLAACLRTVAYVEGQMGRRAREGGLQGADISLWQREDGVRYVTGRRRTLAHGEAPLISGSAVQIRGGPLEKIDRES